MRRSTRVRAVEEEVVTIWILHSSSSSNDSICGLPFSKRCGVGEHRVKNVRWRASELKKRKWEKKWKCVDTEEVVFDGGSILR
jgi:hypothetical protein